MLNCKKSDLLSSFSKSTTEIISFRIPWNRINKSNLNLTTSTTHASIDFLWCVDNYIQSNLHVLNTFSSTKTKIETTTNSKKTIINLLKWIKWCRMEWKQTKKINIAKMSANLIRHLIQRAISSSRQICFFENKFIEQWEMIYSSKLKCI